MSQSRVIEELLESTDTAELLTNYPKSNKEKEASCCFVAVHIGAGFHSQAKTPAYRTLCETICSEVIELLGQGYSARDAVAYAASLLEVDLYQCYPLICRHINSVCL